MSEKKRQIYVERAKKIRMTTDLSTKIIQVGKQWNNIFKVQERVNLEIRKRENIFQK